MELEWTAFSGSLDVSSAHSSQPHDRGVSLLSWQTMSGLEMSRPSPTGLPSENEYELEMLA